MTAASVVFAAFFVVVPATISRWPGAATFITAALLALAIQGASITLIRPPPSGSRTQHRELGATS
jgi:VIT1/CCC1 family predicted Fe2+/Mn2+ transporter